MITKGIITSIDYNTNVCQVRLPVFEPAGAVDAAINEATFSILPGLYNGYKVGDRVYVDFEDNQLNNPVVIGKLYISSEEESSDPRGMLNCANIATQELSMPVKTKIISEPSFANKLEGGACSYGTIEDIIKKLQEYEYRIAQLEEKIEN